MRPLRAYLLVRREANVWDATVHRDLESLQEAWLSCVSTEVAAVVHVGFWRPETTAFEAVAAQWGGRVLVTAAARYALPATYAVWPVHVGEAEGIPLYVALQGWGYDATGEELGLTDTPSPSLHSHAFQGSTSTENGWPVLNATPEVAADARAAGIVDETTYRQLEAQLPLTSRRLLGLAVYSHHVGCSPMADSLIDNLQFAPPWFLALPISSLNLSTRSSNCMRENCIQVVGDLTLFDRGTLLSFEKFGRGSLRDLELALVTAFQVGPKKAPRVPPRLASYESASNASLSHHEVASSEITDIKTALITATSLLADRDARIMRMRMGLDDQPKTLQEIGEVLELTRERIRQCEQHSVRILRSHEIWACELEVRLERLLADRQEPLPLLGLEILDPWFKGAESVEAPLEFALEHFCGKRFSLIRIGKEIYVSRLKQSDWEAAIRTTRQLMESAVSRNSPEEEVRAMIDSLLVGPGEELRPRLWDEATRWARFAAVGGDDGHMVLIGVGGAAENTVASILSTSDRPLHYAEIADRCAKVGRRVDIRRAHNAAANVGLLFGRGIYGLAKHFPLSISEREMLVEEVENLIEGTDPTKQWHAREIAEAMVERGIDFDERLTPYVVSIALKESQHLVDLGRMVWTSKSTGARGSSHRIDVHQAVVSLLMAEGRPMRSSEIRERIARERGLNCFFQIHVEEPLIRLGRGYWGLTSRDLPFSEGEGAAIVDRLVLRLRERGKGLHVSEIQQELDGALSRAVEVDDPTVFIGLAQRDDRCATSKGQIIFLREWGEPRRLTAQESVRRALLEAGSQGLTLQAVAEAAECLAERPIPRLFVGQSCSHLGAIYNSDSMCWVLSQSGEVEEELDEEPKAMDLHCSGQQGLIA